MTLKDADDRSQDIAELKGLKDTAPRSYQAAIQQQIDNIYAGVAGEQNSAHFLKRELGSSQSLAVLHDLRLGVGGEFTQIDHLVIHRVQAAAWVLETKNYAGRLSCDEHGDWTVWKAGKPRSIPSPINQARRQCEMLRLWLKGEGIKFIKQVHPVVLISPTSSIDRRKLPADTHVVKADNFVQWWRKQADAIGIGTALGMVSRHFISGMSPNDFVALGKRLAEAHTPPTYDWRAILRLPLETSPESSSSDQPESPQAAPGKVAGDAAKVIATPHGQITITRIPDGRYALRNEKNEALIAVVRSACKGKAQWNPRFSNWLIREGELPGILAEIQSLNTAPSQAMNSRSE